MHHIVSQLCRLHPGRLRALAAHLVCAYENYSRRSLGEGLAYKTGDIPPLGFIDRGKESRLLVMPLCFQQEQIGIVVFGDGPDEGMVYELLRWQFSGH